MRLLFLDFLRRRWWLLAGLFAFATLQLAVGISMVVTPYALVVLIFDAQRGLFRAVRTLPVTRRAQSFTWWFLGVMLVPLLVTIANFLGAFLYQLNHSPLRVTAPGGLNPWLVAAGVTWVGFGYAALVFLVCVGLPTRVASTRLETIWQSVFGGLWGLTLSGPSLFMFILPTTVASIARWHWVLAAAVPFLVIASYLTAPEMTQRRMSPPKAALPDPNAAPEPTIGGDAGTPLLLKLLLFRPIGMLLFVVLAQMLVLRLFAGQLPTPDHFVFQQIAGIAVFIGSIGNEFVGMRSLRVLPIATARLAALLLTLPVASGLTSTLLVGALDFLYRVPLPTVTGFLAQFLSVSGFSALSVACTLHITSGWRIAVYGCFSALGVVAFNIADTHALPLALASCATFITAALLLIRGLRRSSAFYQPRRFAGINFSAPFTPQ